MTKDQILKVVSYFNCGRVSTSGGNIIINCPLSSVTHKNGSDAHPSLSIKITAYGGSPWMCWACGSKGRSVTGLLFKMLKLGIRVNSNLIDWVKDTEREELTQQLSNAMVNFSAEKNEAFGVVPEESVHVWDEAELDSFDKAIPEYFIGRGYSLKTGIAWGLRHDKKSDRLIIPVRNALGKLVGVFGRALDHCEGPRYKNYLNFNKSKILLGEDKVETANVCTLPGSGGIFLTEGFFDMLRFWEMGYRNTVCCLGSHVSNYQAEKLLQWQRPVYLFQDFDDSGNESKERLVSIIKGRVPLLNTHIDYSWSDVVTVKSNGDRIKDPDECSPELLFKIIKNSKLILQTGLA